MTRELYHAESQRTQDWVTRRTEDLLGEQRDSWRWGAHQGSSTCGKSISLLFQFGMDTGRNDKVVLGGPRKQANFLLYLRADKDSLNESQVGQSVPMLTS